MLDNIDDNEEYAEAVTNIFVESMRAPGKTLHSKAVPLFNSIANIASATG
jgi:hypothetical protein